MLDPTEEAIFSRFLPPSLSERKSLADIIMAKIREHESYATGSADHTEEAEKQAAPERFINPKVVEVYGKVGELLSRYKSGKLPKAFKIIPTLSNWEDILVLTRPDKWTPNAVFVATRMFTANLKSNQTQK